MTEPVRLSETMPQSLRLRRVLVHGLRVLLFGLIVLLIHVQHEKFSHQSRADGSAELPLAEVQELLPEARAFGTATTEEGREVLDENGNSVGFALETSPTADHIIGFSGPTNVLLVFDREHRLLGAKILATEDTEEHADAVRRSAAFWDGFRGQSWDEIAAGEVKVEAVSGATLTSLAIYESIVHRLGGEKPASLRFPRPVEPADVRPLFPKADSLGPREGRAGFQPVFSEAGRQIGSILSTSPAADGVIGYQGPSEVLMGFDAENRFVGFILRGTFDNQEYVDYVRKDEYFPTVFEGMTPRQFSELDLMAAGVEGVSGATMTSQAVAEAMKRAARESLRPKETKPAPKAASFQLSFRDWGTISVLAAGLLLGMTRLRGRRRLRIAFQIVLIVYLGFINGDLVSQALLVGWAEHGIAWQSATGLVLLSAAAVLLPIVSKQNIYCHQLCPHGALQQLIKKRLPWQLRLPKTAARLLSAIPAVLLGVVVAVPMLGLTFSLVNIEPFDAYVFRLAGRAALAIFFGGLVASLFVPMAYCRFGCPTGAILGYLRFHSQSDRLGPKDAVAFALVLMALAIFAMK